MNKTNKTLLEYVSSKHEKAESIIRSGKVMINNEVCMMPNTSIKDSDEIRINLKDKYVSRGAYKLEKAIEVFKIDLNNKVVLDIGCSTGGFTQVSLLNGASKVYALDVGTNVLDYSLRSNDKVIVMEKTNLKTIDYNNFKDVDVVVTDVSFISLKQVFKVIENFGVDIMALIKPQFEANSDQVEEGGFVSEDKHEDHNK